MSDDETTPPDRDETPPPTPEQPQRTHEQPQRPRLARARDGRLISGVCAGLARHLGVDPLLVRVAAVALTFFGGAGFVLYLAGVLLLPAEDAGERGGGLQSRALAVIGVVALVTAGGLLLTGGGWGWGWGWGWGNVIVPLVLLALLGVGVWWLASGEHPAGSPREVLRRAALGLVLLAACGVLAVGGAWAAGVGDGTTVAVIAICAGVALIGAGALLGGGRWLILPALALALPVAAVSAADLDLRGGIGERSHRPLTRSDVREGYRLGVGRLVVDLRGAQLSGEQHVKLDIGVGEAIVIVGRDVCVSARSHVGVGRATILDHSDEGADVDSDVRNTPPPGTPHVVLDADVGLGEVQVRHTSPPSDHDFDGGPFHDSDDDAVGRETNAACEASP